MLLNTHLHTRWTWHFLSQRLLGSYQIRQQHVRPDLYNIRNRFITFVEVTVCVLAVAHTLETRWRAKIGEKLHKKSKDPDCLLSWQPCQNAPRFLWASKKPHVVGRASSFCWCSTGLHCIFQGVQNQYFHASEYFPENEIAWSGVGT